MIKDQVVSQELSEELNSLGITVPSVFYWALQRSWKTIDGKLVEVESVYTIQQSGQITESNNYSAYMIGEIGAMLSPENLKLKEVPESFFQDDNTKFFQNLYSANYWAELLIHLIKYNKVDIEEINKRS